MTEKESTFLVTHAEDESAVVSDVHGGQVHTLSSNPGLDVDEVLEGTVTADPPMEVTWSVTDVVERKTIPVEATDERPTPQAFEMAEALSEGELATTERAGVGEVHVLAVPSENVEAAVADVLDDQATLERAARIGIDRVEVRSSVEDGFVSVRYLP